jgi:arginine/lysine/ornithine decarboxylase
MNTPIFHALIEHIRRARLPLHVPGHKQGRLLPAEFSAWLGTAAKIDLTELEGLDNLHNPTGCILASEQAAADFYGSNRCYFSVNGSTAGVMAAIMACVQPGQKVLFLNAFHQSAWRGLILADAVPAFVSNAYDPTLLVECPPSLEAVEQKLQEIDNVGAVFVTSPTYQGIISPIEAIAEIVHDQGIPLIVDEAHGAHLGLVDEMPKHSVACGADIVVHSVHKMLPGLTQSAWVHCSGSRIDPESVFHALSMLQTTSPSYLLLASLDAVQAWVRTPEARELTKRALAALSEIDSMADERFGGYVRDPFRHWIPTGNLETSQWIQKALMKHGIFVEYADHLGVLSMFGLGTTSRDVRRYLDALSEAYDETGNLPIPTQAESPLWQRRADDSAIVMRPREVHYARQEWVDIARCEGRIASAPITPYPPGVPVVFPGQCIQAADREMLIELSRGGYDVHGVNEHGQIRVVAERTDHIVHHI